MALMLAVLVQALRLQQQSMEQYVAVPNTCVTPPWAILRIMEDQYGTQQFHGMVFIHDVQACLPLNGPMQARAYPLPSNPALQQRGLVMSENPLLVRYYRAHSSISASTFQHLQRLHFCTTASHRRWRQACPRLVPRARMCT